MVEKEIIKESRSLYFDIDGCITELLRARTEHNAENEGKALFRMEGLMVATLQHLACIMEDGHSEKPNNHLEGLDEAAYTIPLKLLTENKASYGLDSTGMRYPMDCFKAGAEWAIGQGETYEVAVIKDGIAGFKTIQHTVESFEPDEDVVIQIRKKR